VNKSWWKKRLDRAEGEPVSDYALDRKLADQRMGAHSREQTPETDVDLRWSELRREQEAFAQRPLPSWLRNASAKGPERTPRLTQRTIVPVLASIALAATAVMVLLPRIKLSHLGTSRTKGQYRMSFDVVSPEGILSDSTTTAHPGDQLQWTVHLTHPIHVAILGRDAAGAVQVYYPQGLFTEYLTTSGPLPVATELDDVLGDEQIYTIFCDRRVQLTALRKSLETRATQDLAHCDVRQHHLRKVPR